MVYSIGTLKDVQIAGKINFEIAIVGFPKLPKNYSKLLKTFIQRR